MIVNNSNSVCVESAVGTTPTPAKVMTKTEIKENKMLAIKASIVEEAGPLGEVIHEFEKKVSEITCDEADFNWKIWSSNCLNELSSVICDKVMLSKMSADNKLDLLNLLDLLVYYVNLGGYLTACSDDENNWNEMVRRNADMRIAMCNECEKRGLNNK